MKKFKHGQTKIAWSCERWLKRDLWIYCSGF